MSYTLNSIDLKTTIGFIPLQRSDSTLALTGFLDMPERLGKCFHDWGMIHGIEPYTSPSDIRFGGRDLSLYGVIIGTSKEDCAYKVNALNTLINSFTGLVPLSCDYGIFQVYVNAAVTGEYLGDNGIQYGVGITIPFREPVVDISGTIPASDGDLDIDGISFSALGAVLITFTGDRWHRPAPKSSELTAYFSEGYKITKTEALKLGIRLLIQQPTFELFKSKIQGLYALFSAPGERNLLVKDDLFRRVFACSGFKVSELKNINNSFYGFVDIELMQAGLATEPMYLGDNLGNYITDNLNNKILVSWM